MQYKPHEYQTYATEFILAHPVAAILLSMGLGKSVITLTALFDLCLDRFEIGKTLIIAPLASRQVDLARRDPEMGSPAGADVQRCNRYGNRKEDLRCSSRSACTSSTGKTCSGWSSRADCRLTTT